MDNQWTAIGALIAQVGTLGGLFATYRFAKRSAQELRPNSGSTVADSVRRIGTRVDRISADIGGVKKETSHLGQRLEDHIDGRAPRRRTRKEST